MAQFAILALADGSLFRGVSIGAAGSSTGEVVFNTSMTGYQEILTDPSYTKQIVTLTYPHIGNTGVNAEDEESADIWASGLVIRSLPLIASNYRLEQSLSSYLQSRNVVAIAEIDTRRLTRLLRAKGAQSGCIATADAAGHIDEQAALDKARAFAGIKGMDLAKEVSVTEKYQWRSSVWSFGNGHHDVQAEHLPRKVVAYDFGVKRNILRMLVERGCDVTVVPAKTPASDVIAMQADGVFLSNGPGDPEPCDYAISAITDLLQTGTPIFGICLGHQLLGLACGAKTVKMKFGHHGANHPVQNLDDGTVMITSQNHGFAIDESSLPANVRVTHKSLFDGTLQGIHHTEHPAFSFQGHPEASPGPHDVAPLFDHFIELIDAKKN